jgi:uncharacterized protein
VAYFGPLRVILLGSAAGSDKISLLMVVDDDAPPERLSVKAGRQSRQAYRQPADVIPCYDEFYQRLRHIPGTLPFIALTEGVVVYERHPQ